MFQDELEKSQHEDAINRLCQQHPEQCDLIRDSYLENLGPMIGDASIRTYLPIFVSRKVEEELKRH